MKKLYLLSFLLPLWTLLPLWGLGGRLFAAVQVKSISTDYANKRVTFALSWAAGTRNATHLSKVWVFVDYTTVTDPNTVSGAWQRATVVSATATSGTVSYDGSNRRGFFVQGADGTFSSTVTVTLSGVPAKFNWCTTATDYPPNVTATGGTYTLHGTAPFTLVAADGVSTQVVNGKSIAASALTVAPVIIRDATGCPGVFCPYMGTDLLVDATHICQQRTSGAQNWEAWIKDARDNELYRIVLMPDNKWWLAQNVKYAGTGAVNTVSGCDKDKCGRLYYGAEMNGAWGGTSGIGANKQGVCPSGWVLPVISDFKGMIDAILPISYASNGRFPAVGFNQTIAQRLQSLNGLCPQERDYYGWASVLNAWINGSTHDGWRSNDNNNCDWSLLLNHNPGIGTNACGYVSISCSESNRQAPVRCFRQL